MNLFCDFISWLLSSDGSISNEVKVEIAQFVAPTGMIAYSAGSSMGSGWLLADGSEVSRTTYANLFALIGTRYGDGNTTTTFNLPDLRGRSPIGAGTGQLGGALTSRDINTIYLGEEQHTQTIAEMPAHHHTLTGPTTRTEERGDGANLVWRGSQNEDTQDTGSGTPFNVVHPCLILYGFIKT